MIPVRDPGNDLRLEVRQDTLDRLGLTRWRRRQRAANLSRPHLRQHRILLGMLEVFGDPIEHGTSLLDELVPRQITAHPVNPDIIATGKFSTRWRSIRPATRPAPTAA